MNNGDDIVDKVIKINIRKKEDYVSKFNDDILAKDLSNYIMEEYKSFNIKKNFYIEISSDYDIASSEKDKITSMIRANFGTEISELMEYRKKTVYMDAIILIFGIIALVFYLFSSNIPILSEFILVFSWVLIWESAYNLIFGGFSNRIDIKRRKNLTNCKIVFK